jgi:hypothetical protein
MLLAPETALHHGCQHLVVLGTLGVVGTCIGTPQRALRLLAVLTQTWPRGCWHKCVEGSPAVALLRGWRFWHLHQRYVVPRVCFGS